MTKNEALKAAIDGKKVRNERWVPECYLCFKENQFFVIGPSAPEGNSLHANGLNYSTGKWQIVPEYVDFAYAWKAYEDGKKVQSFKGYVYEKLFNQDRFQVCFTMDEIRGQWQILDD